MGRSPGEGNSYPLHLRFPWTEEPVELHSMKSQRVRHGWVIHTHTHTDTIIFFKQFFLFLQIVYQGTFCVSAFCESTRDNMIIGTKVVIFVSTSIRSISGRVLRPQSNSRIFSTPGKQFRRCPSRMKVFWSRLMLFVLLKVLLFLEHVSLCI